MNLLDDIMKEFLVESYENLDRLDQDLMALDDVPDDRNRLSSVFRTIHTLKGTSGFLGLTKLEKLTHVGESLLVLLRDGKMRLNRVITDALLEMVDEVRKILANIESTHGEGDADYSELISTLERLQVTGGCQVTPVAIETQDSQQHAHVLESVAKQIDTKQECMGSHSTRQTFSQTKKKRRKGTDCRTGIAILDDLNRDSIPAHQRIFEAADCPDRISSNSSQHLSPSEPPKNVCENSVESVMAQDAPPNSTAIVPGSKERNSTEGETGEKAQVQSIGDSTIRIDVSLLDKLMNLVGELVLARNQILQCSRETEDACLIAASQRLNLITTELQEGVMKTRMQPIQNVWSKLPRVVRDLATTCGKKVQVKMEGAETELDKTILEAIRDPLTHVVRNSVDHGIETPEMRKAKGKPVEGTLTLRAFHESGQVNIEISDDGGGINLARVREKAISQGLITADQAASMPECELINLILLPGFSTAASVTNVSGRGVGMDVVKTHVEKIGGTLDIQSVYGQGTTLRIKIPLTLAIVPALMVTCGDDRYAIPQNNLVELVRLEGDRVRREIEYIHDAPVYRLRGNLLPLLYLDEQLQLRPTRSGVELKQDSIVNIVVLNAENRQFGLVVDQINDTQEIVVKPLGPHLKEISTYAGVTIMGDGTVALILDVPGVAKRAHIVTEGRDKHQNYGNANEQPGSDSKQTLLLIGMGESQLMAIPLSLVARLEEIPFASIERADGQNVVQYGGQIMPLINLGEILNSPSSRCENATNLQVVVYSENGRSVGLVVDRILDIVETVLTVQGTGKRLGVLGSAVIQNRVTDLLDIHNLILSTDQDFFGTASPVLAV